MFVEERLGALGCETSLRTRLYGRPRLVRNSRHWPQLGGMTRLI